MVSRAVQVRTNDEILLEAVAMRRDGRTWREIEIATGWKARRIRRKASELGLELPQETRADDPVQAAKPDLNHEGCLIPSLKTTLTEHLNSTRARVEEKERELSEKQRELDHELSELAKANAAMKVLA